MCRNHVGLLQSYSRLYYEDAVSIILHLIVKWLYSGMIRLQCLNLYICCCFSANSVICVVYYIVKTKLLFHVL